MKKFPSSKEIKIREKNLNKLIKEKNSIDKLIQTEFKIIKGMRWNLVKDLEINIDNFIVLAPTVDYVDNLYNKLCDWFVENYRFKGLAIQGMLKPLDGGICIYLDGTKTLEEHLGALDWEGKVNCFSVMGNMDYYKYIHKYENGWFVNSKFDSQYSKYEYTTPTLKELIAYLYRNYAKL